MNQQLRIPFGVLIGLLIGVGWELAAKVSSFPQSGIAHPLFSIFLVSAAVLLIGQLIFDRNLPWLTLRSFQGSTFLGLIYFLLPSLLAFRAIKIVSPLIAVMAFGTVPLWFWMFKMGRGAHRIPFLLACLVGIGLFFKGSMGSQPIVTAHYLAVLSLVFASFLCAVAVIICRKVFWIHSSLELNFWAMLVAALISALLLYLFTEPSPDGARGLQYWAYLLSYALITGGIAFGDRFVTFHASQAVTLAVTLAVAPR